MLKHSKETTSNSQSLLEKETVNNKQISSSKSWNIQPFIQKHFGIKKPIIKQFMAELYGTVVMNLYGIGASAQYTLSKADSSPDVDFFSINFAVGISLTVCIIIAYKNSGGFLSPAIAFAACLTGKINFIQFIVYSIANFLGTFIAAALVFVNYYDSLRDYPTGMFSMETAMIFITGPNKHLGIFNSFFDQTLGTFVLITAFLALGDKKNSQLNYGVMAILAGFNLTLIGTAFGFNAGYAISPARDFAPRLFTLIAGWGPKVFSAGNYFFWIPLVAPMLGSFIAVVIYSVFIPN